MANATPIRAIPPSPAAPDAVLGAQALAFCALFAVADAYGATGAENTQRRIAHTNLAYIATCATDDLYYREHRYCGIAFEMPLLLAERALRLQDSRHIYLTLHLLAHPFSIFS